MRYDLTDRHTHTHTHTHTNRTTTITIAMHNNSMWAVILFCMQHTSMATVGMLFIVKSFLMHNAFGESQNLALQTEYILMCNVLACIAEFIR